MSKFVDLLSVYFLNHNMICEDDIPWFKYGIEKRITTIIVMIPFFIIAVVLANLSIALSFFFSFYTLRSRTNGYHANSFWACFLTSLFIEVLFLGIIYPLLNRTAMYIIAFTGTMIIFLLAPYNHPNMHLTEPEVCACRLSSRIRASCMLIVIAISGIFSVMEVAKGLTLGMAMAALLLCLAYLLNGGSKNEKCNRSN